LTRKATASLTIGTAVADTNRHAAVRKVKEIPIKIVGHPQPKSSGSVELRVEGLPEGVRVSGRSVVPKGEAVGTVRLVRDETASPIAREDAVRVVGVARMPRGVGFS
jgi:hypothetical protein